MGTLAGVEERFAAGFADVWDELRPHLDERQRRLLPGSAARQIGRGGIAMISAVTGVAKDTVSRGATELDAGIEPDGRVRGKGAGRKAITGYDPEIGEALELLVDPESRGDPMRALRWTAKSTARLAGELTRQGHRCSARTAAALLKRAGFSLHGNAKTIEGARHPDRDAQFEYINTQVNAFQAGGQPVISVDTKKKELVGDYASGGREREPRGHPRQVNDHDFPDKELGKVAPYGVYDMTANAGWVNVGTSAGTAQFAVESIRRWRAMIGKNTYQDATRLLITADAGGPDGARLRLWKTELARFAGETGLEITVARFPPGTSKWNRAGHRLFSFITMNWRARPLESHEVVIETIAATTTRTGLVVRAMLDTSTYETGIRISDKDMKTFEASHLHRHDFHGNWNYTIKGTSDQDTTRPGTQN